MVSPDRSNENSDLLWCLHKLHIRPLIFGLYNRKMQRIVRTAKDDRAEPQNHSQRFLLAQ